jgi:hypothetical protein
MALQTMVPTSDRETTATYARMEEKILERDQVGTSDALYDLIRARRPLTEILTETVRMHAPYTFMPYHQRLDDGFARFVNNDHCLLSARASLRLPAQMPEELRFLPMAQTAWYVPTGLDPWNQLLGEAPGHYTRRKYQAGEVYEEPTVHWDDQEPLHLDGTYDEKLNHWLTLVMRGEVIESYRLFLGLLEDEQNRPKALAQLVFAGLIDVQDRMLYNRSYTTGHKSYRARATVELGEAVGWDNAHSFVYAGVPDIAVGPRWYSAYEMACQISLTELAEVMPESTLSPTGMALHEERLLANKTPLTDPELDGLIEALIRQPEPAYIKSLVSLLLAGKDPVQIIETMQIASARLVLQTNGPRNYSMPQHTFEYMNTLAWFFRTFNHKHRLKLLFVAGSFINQSAMWLRNTPGNGVQDTTPPSDSHSLSASQLLHNVDGAITELDPPQGVAWSRAYLEAGHDRSALVQTLAVAAAKMGNDPHNQELGLAFVDDYQLSGSKYREELLLAGVQHTAGHMKYGDVSESYQRFATAFGISTNGEDMQGIAEPLDVLLDD